MLYCSVSIVDRVGYRCEEGEIVRDEGRREKIQGREITVGPVRTYRILFN